MRYTAAHGTATTVVHDSIGANDPHPLQVQLKHDGEGPEVAIVGHVFAGPRASRQHLEYLIVTESARISSSANVQRRFSDFIALSYELAQAGEIVPSLPSKHSWYRRSTRLTPTFAAKRQAALQAWLNEVLRHSSTKVLDSAALRQFLGVSSRPEVPTTDVRTTLDALAASLRVAEAFGSVMALAKQSDEANLAKIAHAAAKLQRAGRLPRSPPWLSSSSASANQDNDEKTPTIITDAITLRALLTAETEAGAHRPGSGVLAEGSAALATLWLLRSMRFLLGLLTRMQRDQTTPLPTLARTAYSATLEAHHGLWLRSTVRTALGAMPTREAFYCRTRAPGDKRDAAACKVASAVELEGYVAVLRGAVDAVEGLLQALALDDHRKA